MVFLEQMRLHGHNGGLLMIPGSVADFTGSQLISLTHPVSDESWRPFSPPARPTTSPPTPSAWHRCWPPRRRLGAGAGEPLLEPLRGRFEPIMLQSDQICDGIGYRSS